MEMLRLRRRREGLEVAVCREEMVQAGWGLASGGEREKAREVAEAILAPFSREGSGGGGTGKTPLADPFPGPCELRHGEEGGNVPTCRGAPEVSPPGFLDKRF